MIFFKELLINHFGQIFSIIMKIILIIVIIVSSARIRASQNNEDAYINTTQQIQLDESLTEVAIDN